MEDSFGQRICRCGRLAVVLRRPLSEDRVQKESAIRTYSRCTFASPSGKHTRNESPVCARSALPNPTPWNLGIRNSEKIPASQSGMVNFNWSINEADANIGTTSGPSEQRGKPNHVKMFHSNSNSRFELMGKRVWETKMGTRDYHCEF